MKEIIKFYTPQCISCKVYDPIFNKVSKNFSEINFKSLDATKNRELARQFGVRGVPATIFIKDGEESFRFMGPLEEKELITRIKQL